MNPPCLQPPVRVQENYSHVDLDDMKWKESFAHDRWRDLPKLLVIFFVPVIKGLLKASPASRKATKNILL